MEKPVPMPRFEINTPPLSPTLIPLIFEGRLIKEISIPFSPQELEVLQNARLAEALLHPSMLRVVDE